jgi:4-hydroxy-3-methylbut-2-en-1-yl diphosphate reductase
MQIEKASELGLCFGVRRALGMLREEGSRYGNLETLGPIAHNRVLLAELEEQGVRTVASPEGLAGPAVVVSAHGIAPDVMRQLADRGFTIIDTTCPNVSRAQCIAANMAQEGLTVVIFGDAAHSEVRGLLGWAGRRAIATMDASIVASTSAAASETRLGIISQTTQRVQEFSDFVQQVCAGVLAHSREIRVVNTLCDATRRRQAAAADLARTVDAMIVIGGRNSANTLRLAETCAAITETHHIESADELDETVLRGKERVGLTAGASTPDSSIDQVECLIRGL